MSSIHSIWHMADSKLVVAVSVLLRTGFITGLVATSLTLVGLILAHVALRSGNLNIVALVVAQSKYTGEGVLLGINREVVTSPTAAVG